MQQARIGDKQQDDEQNVSAGVKRMSGLPDASESDVVVCPDADVASRSSADVVMASRSSADAAMASRSSADVAMASRSSADVAMLTAEGTSRPSDLLADEEDQDAESLSNDESDSSSSDVEEIELFKFSRLGLSAWIDLRAGRPSECVVVSFEELCGKKYHPSSRIGSHAPRFAHHPPPSEADLKRDDQQQNDRLASVVADIERRLNRYGFIGDPRSVCQKGGGKSGKFYEEDNQFFDDTDAYEQLGIESLSTSDVSDAMSDDNDDSDDDDEGVDYYFAESLPNFTFDNAIENDEKDLFENAQPDKPQTEDLENPAGRRDRRTDPKAWRLVESKLPEFVRKALGKLEDDLEPLCDKNETFTKKKQILALVCETVKQIFNFAYPQIGWEIKTTFDDFLGEVETNAKCNTIKDSLKGLQVEKAGTEACINPDYDSVVEPIDTDLAEAKSEEKSSAKKRRPIRPPRRYYPKNLVHLKWDHYDDLVRCFKAMMPWISKRSVDSLWINRVVLHNAHVYNELEHALCDHIFKHSILFRKEKSHFFRDVKRVQEMFQNSYETLPFFAKSVSADKKLTSSFPGLEDVTKLPFFPVAVELLNWAVLYNSRRYEFKSVGFPVDVWSVSFSKYFCDKLNTMITARRKNIDKQRLVVKRLFLEELLSIFKQHFNVSTLYEKRSSSTPAVQFIAPCFAIGLRGLPSSSRRRKSVSDSAKMTSGCSKSDAETLVKPAGAEKTRKAERQPPGETPEEEKTENGPPKKRRRKTDGSGSSEQVAEGCKKRKRSNATNVLSPPSRLEWNLAKQDHHKSFVQERLRSLLAGSRCDPAMLQEALKQVRDSAASLPAAPPAASLSTCFPNPPHQMVAACHAPSQCSTGCSVLSQEMEDVIDLTDAP